jgi:hypothetical protein
MVTTLAAKSATVNSRPGNGAQRHGVSPIGVDVPIDADQPASRATLPQSRHRLIERLQPQAKRT